MMLVDSVGEATGGLGAICVMPFASFMADVVAWEIQHGWQNMKEGFSPDENNGQCQDEK